MTSTNAPHRVLMVILAHPDDESTTAGGVLAHYARQDVTTVVVTCTNGEYGDRPYGVERGPEHDTVLTARTRLKELHQACEHLGVTHLELLGYHDSGTVHPKRRGHFCAVGLDEVRTRLTALIDQYRPQVVLTHEPSSTRHPDHVHAAQAAKLAVDSADQPIKFYYTAHGTRYWRKVYDALAHAGIEKPAPSPERLKVTDLIDQQITTTVDISDSITAKRKALFAHASQLTHATAAKVSADLWPEVFGTDDFIHVHASRNRSVLETDLFEGLDLP